MNNGTLKADILVIGAGIAGISAALEAAETGFSVILVEKEAYIGGRVAQLNEYFPKLCPPSCGLEINTRRLRDNKNIKLLTLAEVQSIEGQAGDYRITVNQKPRCINEKCTACGDCEKVCPVDAANGFNLGLDKRKAAYLPYNNAFPLRYAIDMDACTGKSCSACVAACKYGAIDLNQQPESITISAKSIIRATGWQPYDAKKPDNLGYGKYRGVVTNLELERLAAPNGPTGGSIRVPGLDKDIKSVIFVQCAGSRDENHLEYCSSVCCLASMKQARYIREQYPGADIYIFYIDVRSPGFFEDFYSDTDKDEKIHFIRGKAAKVFEYEGSLVVEAENTIEGRLNQLKADLVVLATGMQPNAKTNSHYDKKNLDNNGFIRQDAGMGILSCGVAAGPKDVAESVREAAGAAMQAICIVKGGM